MPRDRSDDEAASRAIAASLEGRGLPGASVAHAAVFAWAASRRRSERTWVLGVSGPQGGGKSTLAESVRVGFEACGLRAIAVSIDDFYLTRAEQVALATAHRGNDLLAVRGYPGTHDVALGERVLGALVSRAPGEVAIPRYDKSAHDGQGDRASTSTFDRVVRPVDVVIFEGWMLGFAPVPDHTLTDERLRAPNALLAAYELWWSRLDATLVMQAPDVQRIVAWRIEAERARRRAGLGALDEAGARAYAERFVPAYQTYLPGLFARARCTPGFARVPLDATRGMGSILEPTPTRGPADQGAVG